MTNDSGSKIKAREGIEFSSSQLRCGLKNCVKCVPDWTSRLNGHLLGTLVWILLFGLPLSAHQATFDVKSYGGALCDGRADDTRAIQNTINAAGAAMQSHGGAVIIYFPSSSGPCVVHELRYPSMKWQGVLISEFDNGLLADIIHLGSKNNYIGRASGFLGRAPAFFSGPSATWVQNHGFSGGPLVDISGVEDVYIEGINIAAMGLDGGPAVHIHDNAGVGSVWLRFKSASIGSERGYALSVDSSGPDIPAGFGLVLEDCSTGEVR